MKTFPPSVEVLRTLANQSRHIDANYIVPSAPLRGRAYFKCQL